jgi:hypothetical protein
MRANHVRAGETRLVDILMTRALAEEPLRGTVAAGVAG